MTRQVVIDNIHVQVDECQSCPMYRDDHGADAHCIHPLAYNNPIDVNFEKGWFPSFCPLKNEEHEE